MRRIFLLTSIFTILSLTLAAQKQFKVLLVTTTAGYHHESIHAGVLALQKLAVKHNFDIALLNDTKNFTDKHLQQFQCVVFLNTTGNIFNDEQQQVFERFIRSGKGYTGIHAASDTEFGWDWYTRLVGRMFRKHPAIQTAKLNSEGKDFPGIKDLDGVWWTDEWYEFGPELSQTLKYILTVDESSYSPSERMGKFHPVSWYQEFDGGRSFYTALGHTVSCYDDNAFLSHLYAGLFWAATGKK